MRDEWGASVLHWEGTDCAQLSERSERPPAVWELKTAQLGLAQERALRWQPLECGDGSRAVLFWADLGDYAP